MDQLMHRRTSPPVSKTSGSLLIKCGTTTRHMTAGSVSAMVKPRTFSGLPIDGCHPVTSISQMLRHCWRSDCEGTRMTLWISNRICENAKLNASAVSGPTYTMSSIGANTKVPAYIWSSGVCWTPESNIDDKAWVVASLKANQNQHNRRSMRLEDSFEARKKGFDKMMSVVNLE